MSPLGTFSPGVFWPGGLLAWWLLSGGLFHQGSFDRGLYWPGGLLAGGIFVWGAFVRGAYARSPQIQCVYALSRLSALSIVA